MYIRPEKPEDHIEIYELVKTAFETAAVKDGDEQDYVVKLRASSRYIPELALVAVECGINPLEEYFIGHIMLTHTELTCGEDHYQELLLSPLCVSLPYRNKGVGGALIKESFRLAANMGYSSVFLCGDPEYYKRYGFKPAGSFGIRNTGDLDPKYVMACELIPGALSGRKGTISIV